MIRRRQPAINLTQPVNRQPKDAQRDGADHSGPISSIEMAKINDINPGLRRLSSTGQFGVELGDSPTGKGACMAANGIYSPSGGATGRGISAHILLPF